MATMLQKAGKIICIKLAKLAWCIPVSALFSFYLCKLVLFDKKYMIQHCCCDLRFTGECITSLGDNPIRFGAMGPWSQAYIFFTDLVRMGEFVLAYLPNLTSYGHDTYIIGYSRDWGLRGCVEILWQPHWIWSYELVKSAMFHGFGSGGLFHGAISPEHEKPMDMRLAPLDTAKIEV